MAILNCGPDTGRLNAFRLALAALAWAAAWLCGLSPAAAQTTVDFENLVTPAILSQQLGNRGMAFNGPRAMQYPAGFAHSGTKAIELCFAAEFCTAELVITLAAGQRNVSLWVGSSQPREQASRVVMRAFDANNQLLGEVFTDFGVSTSPIRVDRELRFGIGTAAIRRVTVGYVAGPLGPAINNGLVIDDVTITGDTGFIPCNIFTPATIDWTVPEAGKTVNINVLRITGSVQSIAPLEAASLTIEGAGGTKVVELLSSGIFPVQSGGFNTNIGDALYPGVNKLTLSAKNCWVPVQVRREVTYAPLPAGASARLDAMEIVQAAQRAFTPVPLVAGKPAVVRAFVSIPGASLPIGDVRGQLIARRPGGMVLGPIASIAPAEITNTWPQARQREAGAIHFRIPDAWTAEGYTHFEVSQITIADVVPLPCTNCAQFALPNVPQWAHFRSTRQMNLILAPYVYLASSPARSPDILLTPMGALQWLNNVYPLRGDFPGDNSGINLMAMLPMNSTSRDMDNDEDERGEFLDGIKSQYALLRFANPEWPDFHLMAMVPCQCGGRAKVNGRASFVDTEALTGTPVNAARFSRWGRLWAHELGHNLGRRHAGNAHGEDADKYDTSFPYPHGGIGDPGIATITNFWDPARKFIEPGGGAAGQPHEHDFMSYGGGTSEHTGEWISPYTYERLFSKLAGANAAAQSRVAPREVLVVIGHVKKDGRFSLQSIWRAKTPEVSSEAAAGEFKIELLDEGGSILSTHYFDADPQADGPSRHFSEYVPWVRGTTEIRLSGSSGELARTRVTANAPSLRIATPRYDERRQSLRITWIAGDVDGDALSFAVLYSRGEGKPWLPIASRVTGSSLEIDSRLLPGSSQGRIRVIATDGANSVEADSSIPFAVADKPPQVGILFPGTGREALQAGAFELIGAAFDREEGLLTGRQLQWRSDRDGVLGEGARVTSAKLSPGRHKISLTARDNARHEATTDLVLTVGPRPSP